MIDFRFLGWTVGATYQVILEHAEDGICTLTDAVIAEMVLCSPRSVAKAVSILKEEGLIRTSRKGGSRKILLPEKVGK